MFIFRIGLLNSDRYFFLSFRTIFGEKRKKATLITRLLTIESEVFEAVWAVGKGEAGSLTCIKF